MRAEFRKKLETYNQALKNAQQDQIPRIKNEFDLWYSQLSQEEKDEFKPYWKKKGEKIDRLINECWELVQEIQAIDEQEKRERLLKASA